MKIFELLFLYYQNIRIMQIVWEQPRRVEITAVRSMNEPEKQRSEHDPIAWKQRAGAPAPRLKIRENGLARIVSGPTARLHW
ncbi:MAG: hypothetical protein LBT41_06105, partial [Candidatus Methanoplasma sp.]|nr:hypothetical protein [Candidatus Methanoplasma sp.]